MHARLKELGEWKDEIELLIKVVQKLQWLIVSLILATAGTTVWLIQYLTKQIDLGA
jgi:hypothetical protein